VNDALFSVRAYKQPLRALMYERLIWTHLFGIHAKDDFPTDAAGIGVYTNNENGNRLTNAVRKLTK
jgi:hypothetical protein